MLSKDEKEILKTIKKFIENQIFNKLEMNKKVAKILFNLLTKLQKENEYWKKRFEKELEDNRKNTTELLKQDLIIRKQDKQIDLMATTLSAICTGLSTVRDHFEKEYCEFINSDKDCCWKTDTSCKDCIKQYFERKVRDERN